MIDLDLVALDERYAAVRERVAAAAARSGRRADDIILVAVTKFAEPDQIRRLIELGHRDFGENRVQNLLQRAAMVEEHLARLRVLPQTLGRVGSNAARSLIELDKTAPAIGAGGKEPVRWHMIGHLQRNKARKACEVSRLIHSVDSLRLAEELQTIALRRDKPLDILVEVNCSGEASKHGCPVPAAGPLAEQIDTMINVRVRGLMTMAAPDVPETEIRATFARCRELFDEIRRSGISEGSFNLLSMGMSGDYEIAIEEGANIVRVGSAIFGEHPADPDADEDEAPADDLD
ncbi:MAG: YggS family pyridoxal phosphate-dependent enzyme [Phycisphaeraceae bacterium]|nr:YggS family pyridoxal phosphate-dependent enzyme [Phycisphaeraceae bacterium]